MTGMLSILQVARSGLNAEEIRYNTIASNISNQNSVYKSDGSLYKSLQPVYETVVHASGDSTLQGVSIAGIAEVDRHYDQEHRPWDPHADENGMVLVPAGDELLTNSANLVAAANSMRSMIHLTEAVKKILEQVVKSIN